jgi:hypothetical protein
MTAAHNSPSDVQPQDRDSGLVERSWVRRSRRHGELTERTLEGKHVEVTFLDRNGHLQQEAGMVRRNDAGELVLESWADGVRRQTHVTRDASVNVPGREPSR